MARRRSSGWLVFLVVLSATASVTLLSIDPPPAVPAVSTPSTFVDPTVPSTTTSSAAKPPSTTAPPATVPAQPAEGEEPAGFVSDLPAGAVEILAGGDVNLGGTIGKLIAASGPAWPWRKVAPLLQRADIAVVNLECAVSLVGEAAAGKQYTFQGDPASLPAMREAGVDIAGLANNHANDFGHESLLATVANLSGAGITPIGAGANEDAAFKPATIEAKGKRITFISATRVLPPGWAATAGEPGVASAYNEKRLLGEVRQAKASSDVVVVAVHWGIERMTTPDASQVRLAHRLVDAGASIILGSHPHVLQPVVRYKGAVIAYSLGNFVFTAGSVTQTSMLLRIGIMPDGALEVVKVPLRISGGQPAPL